VPGARRVGRRLSAPLLGTLTASDLQGERSPHADSLVLQLRLAAVHARVSSVALVDLDGVRQLDGLADMLTSAMPPTQAAMAADAPPGAAENGSGAVVAATGARSGTAALLTELVAGVEKRALRVMSLPQLQRRVSGGPAGIVVLSGPAARVSRISAVDDLSVSSGWPIIGVVGIPRRRREWPGAAALAKVRFGRRGGAK
jgi:hypothetical protein